MKQMLKRTVAEGVLHHQANPVRVYADRGIQSPRIERSRHFLKSALLQLGPGHKTIVEPGCGTLDISGPFSAYHEVIGVECNEACAFRARDLYPQAVVSDGIIEEVDVIPADVVVLCEVLEHLENPVDLVRRWLPKCRAAVISHPLDEPLDSTLAAGDHCWSFSEEDLKNWYAIAGYSMVEGEKFQMGQYKIGLSRGVNA